MSNLPSLYTSPCWNPYLNSKNGKQVDEIKFFKNGKVIASAKWFSGSNGSNNRFPQINLPTILKQKRNEDLTEKNCFLFHGSIYIPADLVNFRDNGEKFDFECDYMTQYKSSFSIDIEAVEMKAELNEEGKVVYKNTEMMPTTITQFYKHRQVDKPNFIQAGQIANEIEKIGTKISRYDILSIMKVYNFSKIG